MKKLYQVFMETGEATVSTVKEVSELLGYKVTKKDIEAGLVDGVDIVEVDEEVAVDEVSDEDMDMMNSAESILDEEIEDEDDIEEEVEVEEPVVEETNEESVEEEVEVEEPVVEAPKGKPSKEELSKMTMAEKLALITKPRTEGKGKKSKVTKYEVGEAVDYPEKGSFADKEALKDFYKRLTDEHLDEWIELEGLEWKESGNPGIDRMRRCMAITGHHFPSQASGKSKKKSKYAQYSDEDLLQMALDNDLEVKDSKGNMQILRMYLIMTLRENGIIE